MRETLLGGKVLLVARVLHGQCGISCLQEDVVRIGAAMRFGGHCVDSGQRCRDRSVGEESWKGACLKEKSVKICMQKEANKKMPPLSLLVQFCTFLQRSHSLEIPH